jgi:hypothetical protein
MWHVLETGEMLKGKETIWKKRCRWEDNINIGLQLVENGRHGLD